MFHRSELRISNIFCGKGENLARASTSESKAACWSGVGALFQLWFAAEPPRDHRDALRLDRGVAAEDVLARGRLEVQPTEVAEAPEQPDPAPGEGNPPEPARIPEPYPPPDEGSPPQPAVIPEPGPAVIPEPGPQGKKNALPGTRLRR